jgi:hypothetical protein
MLITAGGMTKSIDSVSEPPASRTSIVCSEGLSLGLSNELDGRDYVRLVLLGLLQETAEKQCAELLCIRCSSLANGVWVKHVLDDGSAQQRREMGGRDKM